MFAKALAGEADALSFDLEDSVPLDCKVRAREAVAQLVDSSAARDSAKLILVRVNALDSPEFEADLAAVARPGVDLINLPKIQSAADVHAAVAALERAEAANGMDRQLGLLVTVETPAGLRHAAEIACAHPRVAGLQVGLADLFEPFGIDRREPANVHAILCAVRLAAAEAGVFAWDAAFANLDDPQGFQAEATMAQRLGYVGKSCIHPRQVALANALFMPDAEELARARRIVEAAAVAQDQGRGAFVVDGRMVDLPYLKRARALLASLTSTGEKL